jgi:hypothetical protein
LLGEIAANIANEQGVRIGGVEGRAQTGGHRSGEPAQEKKGGHSGQRLREENEGRGYPRNRQNQAESRAEDPGERRVEDEPRLAEAVVGQGGPPREEDAMLPLVGDIQPGRDMELEIVAGGAAEPEKREQQGQ